MDREKEDELKELLAQNEMSDNSKNRILEILAFESQETDLTAFENTKSIGFLGNDEMQDLIDQYPWLLPYRCYLESNYVIDDDDLLKLTEQLNDDQEDNSGKKLIEKLVRNQETRIALIKLNGGSLLEHMHSFCRSFPSLKVFRSTEWLTIKHQMRADPHWTVDEKQLIQELWCSSSLLRQNILKKSLPLELANDLERISVTEIKDLSLEDFLEFCRDFTAHERHIFEKWYNNAKESSMDKIKEVERFHQSQLQSEFAAAKGEPLSEDPVPTVEDIDPLNQLKREKDIENDVLKSMDEILEAEDLSCFENEPCEMDQDFIAKISGGSALHGFCYGMDATELCKQAPIAILKNPDLCGIKETPTPSRLHPEYFVNKQDGIQLIKAVTETGHSFGFNLKANGLSYNSDKTSSNRQKEPANLSDNNSIANNLTMMNFYIYPTGNSFTFEQNQLLLSENALESLQNVDNIARATKFLKNYGSHLFCGTNHLGGILSQSVEIDSSQQLNHDQLKKIAKQQLDNAASLPLGQHKFIPVGESFEVNCRLEVENFGGPNEKQPERFEKHLRANSSLWRIIDRENLPESLIPIWNVIYLNHSNMKDEADLLCKAWLDLVVKPDVPYFREQERVKEEEKRHNRIIRQNQTKDEQMEPLVQRKTAQNSSSLPPKDLQQALVKEIQSGKKQRNGPKEVEASKEITPDELQHGAGKKVEPQKEIQQQRNNKPGASSNQENEIGRQKTKKPYAAFLIDRPLNATSRAKPDEDNATFILMNCLRYRLRLALDSMKNSSERQLSNKSSTDWNVLLFGNQEQSLSLYDVLLRFIDEFDAAGAVEIFRLLLERRSAVPLFVPASKKHHLHLLKHITLPGGIRLGDDKSLMRVAVISCRKRNESKTCEILKNLFHIDSVHFHDFKKGTVTSENLTAEIGCGCLLTEESEKEKVQNLMVAHVVGDFLPLWPFILEFADYLIIEDATIGVHQSLQRISADIARVDSERGKVSYACVWKPSVDDTRCQELTVDQAGFRHLNIEGQLGGKTYSALKSIMTMAVNEWKTLQSTDRQSLCNMAILEDEGFGALNCVAPDTIESSFRKAVPGLLGNVKKNVLLLQKNFREQAKHEELKCEQRLDKDKVRLEDAAIKKCREKRKKDAEPIQNDPLLSYLLKLLLNEDPCERVLAVRTLEKCLARRSEVELGPQLETIRQLYSLYVEQSTELSKGNDRKKQKKLEVARENLRVARTDFNESVLNIEHLWRELSHLYSAIPPENRTSKLAKVPRLAAQHLVDGFCIELLDGDSNLLHLEWVTEVLHELGKLIGQKNKGRIFVLSIMGVQSSGKSTLLNTMFGIQMRTSVGQCTRGVNMQLLAVEGRPEYDYVLVLDTEGTRAPEFHDLPGSEKRDNQMATLSILLADATIVVIPGENDAAIKEILPIVLMAYQGSKLAESKGGRLSSMMFFVYNRIDTTQKDKLSNIIQTLGTSLHEAFDHVQNLTGNMIQLKSESPFRSFKLDASNSSESDVCILGNVKEKFEPPGDVPDAAYGEALVKFRDHIHQRVTNAKDGTIWKGRSIDEFSKYIEEVWKCIGSANFALDFASVVERDTFDKLDSEYKKIEQQLAEAYRKNFVIVEGEMIKEKSKTITSSTPREVDGDSDEEEDRLKRLECQLKDKLLPTINTLDEEVDVIVNEKGRDKWVLRFQELWRECKKDQARNWERNLKTSFITLFKYEHHVENYKKKMREEISVMFKSNDAANWTESEKDKKFEDMFRMILNKAQERFPPKDIAEEIKKVYQSSHVIGMRSIEIDNQRDKLSCENFISAQTNSGKTNKSKMSESWLLSQAKKYFRHVGDILGSSKKPGEFNENIIKCFEAVYKLVTNLTIGKKCYDDSLVSDVINQTDDIIRSHGISANSQVQVIHIYGRALITKEMKDLQQKWEADNSVYAKLKQRSNKDAMHQYFVMVSQGVQTTKLFTGQMASTLKGTLVEAFEKEMIQRTSNIIRNERWLHDARFMHKHIDLFLANLLKEEKVSIVLDYIRQPQSLYLDVLHQLIANKVPNVDEIWKVFGSNLKRSIETAAQMSLDAKSDRAQTFVDELRNEFLKNKSLQSVCLSTAFMINCKGEYEDCDNEDKMAFKKACVTELTAVLKMKNKILLKKSQDFAKELCPKIVDYMKTLNDPGAMPRCDSCCPVCGSLCIEAANHDVKLKPHDAVHQPGGILGVHYKETGKLDATTCSQSYEDDRVFYKSRNDTVSYRFREFAKIFPEWKDPRINEELPLREYVLATYNEDIAKKYDVLPCSDVPSGYFRELSNIINKLKRDIEK